MTAILCPSCLSPDCVGDVLPHRISVTERVGYMLSCCPKEAARLQAHHDLKRAGEWQTRVSSLQAASGIPLKFAAAQFATYQQTKGNHDAFDASLNFASGYPAKSVLLMGPRGTGKSHLGCAALNQIINLKAVESRYIYTPDLFELLRERFKSPELSTMRVQEVCRVPCLFLDDPGVNVDSEWVQSIYVQIIDARYRENRPTFIASNEGMAGLESILGARSMSRICESFSVVELQGKDRRLT